MFTQITASAADGSGFMDSCNLTVEGAKPVPISGIVLLDEDGNRLKETDTITISEADPEGIVLIAQLLPENTT